MSGYWVSCEDDSSTKEAKEKKKKEFLNSNSIYIILSLINDYVRSDTCFGLESLFNYISDRKKQNIPCRIFNFFTSEELDPESISVTEPKKIDEIH